MEVTAAFCLHIERRKTQSRGQKARSFLLLLEKGDASVRGASPQGGDITKGERMKTYTSDVELDREVAFVMYQHKGPANAIGRWELVALIFGDAAAVIRDNDNQWDRKVREAIERNREKGNLFCNIGNGYFVATSREEYEAFKKYYLGAAYRKLQITAVMDDAADGMWGMQPRETSKMQPSLFG